MRRLLFSPDGGGTVGGAYPGDPAGVDSGKDQEAAKSDADRAKNERELLGEGAGGADPLQLRDPPLTDNPTTVKQPNAVDTVAAKDPRKPTNDPGAPTNFASAANGVDAGDTGTGDGTAGTEGSGDVDGKKLDAQGVKQMGQEILDTFLGNLRGVKLTEDEKGIGLRAAEDLSYYSVASIGLNEEQRAKYQERAQRASSTLLNLAVGVSEDAKRVARDAVRQTIQKFFREALGFLAAVTPLA